MRQAAPAERVPALLASLVSARGAWKSTERAAGETSPTRGTWLVHAERGDWKVVLEIDGDGRVAGLGVTDPVQADLRGLRTADALVATIESVLGPLPTRLRAALLAVDRSRFVRACDVELAFENVALPQDTPNGARLPPFRELLAEHGTLAAIAQKGLLGASGSTISQPLIYAIAFKALGLDEGHRYLDLGSGTGYGAALASHIVGAGGKVTTVDVDPHLVQETARLTKDRGNVNAVCGDGLAAREMVREHDRCWITFAVVQVPEALTAALSEGSALLAPVGPLDAMQMLTRYSMVKGALVEQKLAPVRFIPGRGLAASS
jgi:protein-L-isoaspartate(D-aspartate) O-methyltransferase